MNINQFPHVYKQQCEVQVNQDIKNANLRSESKIMSIKNSVRERPEIDKYRKGGTMLGLVIGFFVCCSTFGCSGSSYSIAICSYIAIGSWIAITIGGMILGIMLGSSVESNHNNSVVNAKFQVDEEQIRNTSEIKKIQEKSSRDYYDYCSEFEIEAQKMSVKFAESTLANQVIEWMVKGYEKTIASADRRSHIEQINVPFSFNVFTNKIICNLGTFDFEIRRCRELTSPFEQTALARALASAIQLNITMKYPKDPSGTDIVTNISYSYGGVYSEQYVAVFITYIAPNGNYKSVQSW